jgi:hypothetical protein
MNIQIQEKDTKAYIKMPDNSMIIIDVEKVNIGSSWSTIWAKNGYSYSTHTSNIMIINKPID